MHQLILWVVIKLVASYLLRYVWFFVFPQSTFFLKYVVLLVNSLEIVPITQASTFAFFFFLSVVFLFDKIKHRVGWSIFVFFWLKYVGKKICCLVGITSFKSNKRSSQQWWVFMLFKKQLYHHLLSFLIINCTLTNSTCSCNTSSSSKRPSHSRSHW